MIPRSLLATLVLALPLLLVTFAVVMAGYILLEALHDNGGAYALLGVGIGILMLLAVDVLLLVGVLGWRMLDQQEPPNDEA